MNGPGGDQYQAKQQQRSRNREAWSAKQFQKTGRPRGDARDAAHLRLQLGEGLPQFGRRLITVVGRSRQATGDDRAEVGRQRFVDLYDWRGFGGENRRQGGDVVVALEGVLARRHLVEHDAQGEDVRAVVDGAALGLLG